MAASGAARKHWEHGGRPTWSPPPRQAVVLVVGGAVLALVIITVARVTGSPLALTGEPDASMQPAASSEKDGDLATTPTTRTGLAFLALDDPLERAEDVLGPADDRTPDINATVRHVWALLDATFEVIADEQTILGLYAHAPVGTAARLHAYGGVRLGTSTPEDVTAAWGEGYDVPQHEGDDFVLRYIVCQGPFPVVVKFDQDGAAPDVRWDEPVTSVLIAYADAEPGTAGCPAP